MMIGNDGRRKGNEDGGHAEICCTAARDHDGADEGGGDGEGEGEGDGDDTGVVTWRR